MKCVLAKRNAGLTSGGYKVKRKKKNNTPQGQYNTNKIIIRTRLLYINKIICYDKIT